MLTKELELHRLCIDNPVQWQQNMTETLLFRLYSLGIFLESEVAVLRKQTVLPMDFKSKVF